MSGENFRDIMDFLTVARERSFTRAAAQLGISQSALSHTIRTLEERIGLRLLARTTRSVSPTEAGERLIQSITPRFKTILNELTIFEKLRNKPAGTVRITASDFATNMILWPKLARLQPKYPGIRIEIAIDPGLTDIVTERFDAGVRFGDQITKDMTSVQISPDIRMVIVGAPSYLEEHPRPKTPSDLTEHECINLRFSTRGGIYAWELSKDGQNLKVKVKGSWIFNSIYPVINAALAGFGLAYIPEMLAYPYLENGQLQVLLQEWSPTFPGLHIFFASQKQLSPALSLVVDELRYK